MLRLLLPDRADEALRVGVGIRRLDRRQHDPHPRVLDNVAECVGPLAVAIADEEAVAREEPIARIGQSPCRLCHEPRIRGRRRARHVNPSTPEIDHEERVVRDQPSRRPDLAGEEVGARNLAPVGPEERPLGGRLVRGRRKSMVLQHCGDRTSRDAVAQVLEGPLDPSVAPGASVRPGGSV